MHTFIPDLNVPLLNVPYQGVVLPLETWHYVARRRDAAGKLLLLTDNTITELS